MKLLFKIALTVTLILPLGCHNTILMAQEEEYGLHRSFLETDTSFYDLFWVSLGDTLEVDSNGIVIVDGLWAMSVEVTQELWYYYMHNNPSPIKGNNLPLTAASPSQIDSFISLISATTRFDWRLPTKEEWLFLYHGALSSQGFAFCGSNRHNWVAWLDNNSGAMLHPIGERIANEVNLHDMLGNAAELVVDNGTLRTAGLCCIDAIPMPFSDDDLFKPAPPQFTGFRLVCRRAMKSNN